MRVLNRLRRRKKEWPFRVVQAWRHEEVITEFGRQERRELEWIERRWMQLASGTWLHVHQSGRGWYSVAENRKTYHWGMMFDQTVAAYEREQHLGEPDYSADRGSGGRAEAAAAAGDWWEVCEVYDPATTVLVSFRRKDEEMLLSGARYMLQPGQRYWRPRKLTSRSGALPGRFRTTFTPCPRRKTRTDEVIRATLRSPDSAQRAFRVAESLNNRS